MEEKKMLLLVEDEAVTALATERILRNFGYSVITAKDGEAALKIIKTTDIDLVLMDIDLGDGFDGTQVAKFILDIVDIPIVFLSGHTEKEVVEKTEKITNYGYVVKNSGNTVLDASIKMAFKLFDAKFKEERAKHRYRDFLENLADAAYETDLEGTIIYVNQIGCELLETPLDQVLESNFLPYLTEESQRLAMGHFSNTLKGETVEFELTLANGRIGSFRQKPSVNKNGIITGVFGTGRDITEQKRTAYKIRKEELKYRHIIKTSMDAFHLIDMEGNILDVNNASCDALGYTKKEFLGMHIMDFDPEMTEESITEQMKIIKEKGTARFRTKHKSKYGKVMDVEVSGTFLVTEDLLFTFVRYL